MHTKSIIIYATEKEIEALRNSSERLYSRGHIDSKTNDIVFHSASVLNEEIEVRATLVEAWMGFSLACFDFEKDRVALCVAGYIHGACQALSPKNE